VIVADKWSAKRTLELIETFSVTTTHMVPTQFVRLLELSEAARKQHDLSSLTHMVHGAAPCPIEIKHRMLDWLGPVVYEYYAASEGGGTLATPKQWLARPGTVGAPWPISTLSIRDDSGNELAPGEVGTVWIHMGDHKFEYHGDKKKTAQAWADRFFTVGDAGYLDEDGFLFLCDRKADMIISGGVNIYPAEIEGSLILHESVADCAVFGIPDDDWGEQVKAVVQLASGNAATLALTNEILAFCGERLAKYKCPRTIDFVEALPRDPNGKLYKRKLREPYWSERSGSI
jgi:long-chain acyl-CoA synthetase